VVEGGVESVEIPLIQSILHDAQQFAEPLVMHNFPCTQEFHDLIDVGVITEAQDIFIGGAGFLLWYDLISTTYSLLF